MTDRFRALSRCRTSEETRCRNLSPDRGGGLRSVLRVVLVSTRRVDTTPVGWSTPPTPSPRSSGGEGRDFRTGDLCYQTSTRSRSGRPPRVSKETGEGGGRKGGSVSVSISSEVSGEVHRVGAFPGPLVRRGEGRTGSLRGFTTRRGGVRSSSGRVRLVVRKGERHDNPVPRPTDPQGADGVTRSQKTFPVV